MDFGLAWFQDEVGAALGFEVPPRKVPRLDPSTSHDGRAASQDPFSTDYGQDLNHSVVDGPLLDEDNGDLENSCLDETRSSVPDLFRPDVDMTTALLTSHPWIQPNEDESVNPAKLNKHGCSSFDASTLTTHECLDVVPNFYAYAVRSCLLPTRQIQNELVSHYFHHIHPMFPVVDELHFAGIHRNYRGREELMEPSDFMIYQAILAAGFGHLSETHLQRTPYRSVHAGQKAQFDQVKARYFSQSTDDPVVLTQLCLIITLWSPGSTEAQNNSYWLNLAFKHATAGELWVDSKTSMESRPTRKRLLWWCCLVRDRVLAIGMRRPHRLHKVPFEETLVTPLDFGVEATSPSYTDVQSKQIEISAFIWLCKLSEVMAAIAVFQRRVRFSRDWNGEKSSASELEEVAAFDQDLRRWKDDFEADAVELIKSKNDQGVLVPFSILRIVSNSLLAVLYQPYLYLSWLDHRTSLTEKCIDPLQRMKEASQAVESSVMDLITNRKTDALPNWLVSWVTLPTAVYHVKQNVQLDSSPDQVLMPFLNRFMRRTTGAQAMFLILTRETKECMQRLKLDENDAHYDSSTVGSESAPSMICQQQHQRYRQLAPSTNAAHTNNRDTIITEAKILAHVTRVLDITLAQKC